MNIPACPHCGENCEVYSNGTAHGPVKRWFGLDGTYNEEPMDNIYSTGYKVLRCQNCDHIRHDLVLSDDKLQVEPK